MHIPIYFCFLYFFVLLHQTGSSTSKSDEIISYHRLQTKSSSVGCALQTICVYPRGADGKNGSQGERGEKGEQGSQGIRGLQGQQGISGLQGEKGDTGLLFLNPVGSNPNTKGATFDNATITLQPASELYSGVLTNSAQSIGGVKTFTSTPIITTGSITFNTFTFSIVQSIIVSISSGSVTNKAPFTNTITAIGVVLGDVVNCNPVSSALEDDLFFSCMINATNTIELRIGTTTTKSILMTTRNWTFIITRV